MYPVDLAMRLIDLTATATGLPYWASIALITVSFRAVMLPLGIVTARNSARMAIMKPELDQLKKAMEVFMIREMSAQFLLDISWKTVLNVVSIGDIFQMSFTKYLRQLDFAVGFMVGAED
ncbi:unnamed protein product, partial [Sphacelaria rigidula]